MTYLDNIKIFQDTQERIQHNIKLQQLTQEAIERTVIYGEGFRSKKSPNYACCKVEFHEMLTLLAATAFTTLKKRTAVLNFANPVEPGGGVLRGANAQEEYLCRASNYHFNCLISDQAKEWYKFHQGILQKNQFSSIFLGTDRVLYTRDITVVKRDIEYIANGQKYYYQQYMNEWGYVDIITCAAPFFSDSGHILPHGDLEWLFINRIKNIFEAAIENQIQALILGAFGCGAFHNPPSVVANAFRAVLSENRYSSAFENIVFAVKRTGPNCENVKVFGSTFPSDFSTRT